MSQLWDPRGAANLILPVSNLATWSNRDDKGSLKCASRELRTWRVMAGVVGPIGSKLPSSLGESSENCLLVGHNNVSTPQAASVRQDRCPAIPTMPSGTPVEDGEQSKDLQLRGTVRPGDQVK